MARKRSRKSPKPKKSKKLSKSRSTAKAKRARPRAKARPKARPRPMAKAKAKARAKASRPPASRRVLSGAKIGAKKPARAVARKVAFGGAATKPGSISAKGRSKGASRGEFERHEPQGMLEFDDGPPISELSRERDIAMPPLPKKRRAKGHQLNMLDYPGESLTVGMQAPEFSLPSTLGRRVSLNEFRGRRVILYFYPKDDTPGCTMEACAFRDAAPRIETKDAVVLGISLDDELSHERFAQKYNLPFPLLSDKDAAVSRQYGTYKEKTLYGRSFWGIERTTFVIDREGKVEHVFRRVKVEGHAEEVMATLAL